MSFSSADERGKKKLRKGKGTSFVFNDRVEGRSMFDCKEISHLNCARKTRRNE